MKVLEQTYLELHGNELLQSKGITKAKFAEQMGMSAQNVNKLLCTNNIHLLNKIANLLGVSVEFLIDGNADGKEEEISGFLKIKGEILEIRSVDDLQEAIQKIK